jgi:hypothetical protein
MRDDALRFARTCYDHIAGQLGVAIADALIAGGHVALDQDGGVVTDRGMQLLAEFGADLAPRRGKRLFCKPCLDWSERRYHIAGLVGAEIWRGCLARGWVARQRDTRAIALTAAGRAGLRDSFGVVLDAEPVPLRAVR